MALASIRIDADLVERAQRGNAAGRRLTWKTFASKAGIWKRFPNKNTVVKNGTLPPGKGQVHLPWEVVQRFPEDAHRLFDPCGGRQPMLFCVKLRRREIYASCEFR